MPRKPQYNIIWEPPKDVGTNADTEEITVGFIIRGVRISREQPRDRAPPFSSLANRAPASCVNEPLCAPRNDKRLAPSSIADDPQTPTERTETRYRDEVDDNQSEDEDYDPVADEVPSFDDQIDDLFAAQEAECQNNNEKRKYTNYWKVTVIELQPIDQVAGSLSGFLESLGADYSYFPICEESWKHVNKAKKEHAYDMIKDDVGGKIKREIIQRIGNNWKDTRHNLYHKCYKETRTFEENLKHRLSGIEENQWKWFLEYRQKEETNEKDQGRPVGRGEFFIITHKKKNGLYIHPDAHVVIFGNPAGQPSGSSEPNEEYERRIAELTAKIEEEKAKRQSIENVLGYIIQQQGGNLPANVAAVLDYLGSTPTSSRTRPSSSDNHDSQQKY
ncbi:hypothetical protein Ahy_B08g092126 [Arachis hypogaea]|uniref:Transposase, Ptta/En/Spm, plant n=1 Tax=Arachis hypogaea TaxID=3818 RepID=A0A444Y373_ARAHY|nr:hypothetical protein Ahy_B08g092126 [Arachis hypogaea]